MRRKYAFVLALLISWTTHCLMDGPSAAAAEDWPMWRGDASRSASVMNSLPSEYKLKWKVNLGARKQAWDDPLNLDLMTYDRVFEPIVIDGVLCVGFNDQDKLVALDAETGEKRWTCYTEAPVRLPPVGYESKIYFCSDDGYLYCVSSKDGRELWKFRGAPNAQHAIGNTRLTSAWPARGGPVVFDDKVYFAASIWPFMGTFIYSLDAESGAIEWVNDQTGAQYIKQPHSAPSFAGVAPQGAMVATDDLLIVPGGRSVPAVFDRKTGELKYFEINAGGKGTGGSFVSADEYHYYVHTREKGTRAFNLTSGLKTAFTPNEPVLSGGFLYSAEKDGERSLIRAYDVSNQKKEARKHVWEIEANGTNELIRVGDSLICATARSISLVKLHEDPKQAGVLTAQIDIDALPEGEAIARLLVAEKSLFVIGDAGSVLAFGDDRTTTPESRKTRLAQAESNAPNQLKSEEAVQKAKSLLELTEKQGYAFWFGPADAPELKQLAMQSPFTQLAVVDSSRDRVRALRKQFDELGLLGKVSVHESLAEEFLPPKYVAHAVFASGEAVGNQKSLSAVYEAVRPYGGKLICVESQARGFSSEDLDWIGNLGLEQGKAELVNLGTSKALVVTRVGALPGASDWTHQYGNVANTVKSDDRRVKLPLGILWFGGSSNLDVLPRHGHGPPEQVVGGRLFIQGMNCLSARDVYTGRVLWKREFEDLGTFDVYYDSTYENTPLNPQYNQVHIPGANGRGTNYVVTSDRIYLVVGARCLIMDPATGEDVATIEMPANEDGSIPEWGFLGVYEDVLLGGVGFANYRDKYELEFSEDAKLRRNRAGFGSKSFDRAASRALIGFDRHSGEQVWRVEAKHSFWHNGIVAGGGKVYCLDKNPTQIEQAMMRRGLSLPDTYRIVALEASTGDKAWQVQDGVFGTWLGYSSQHDLLLQAGAQASDRLYAEVGRGMRVYKASTGDLHWKKDDLKYAGPCILHNELIITNANSYSESAGAFYITNGLQKMVKHPITGSLMPWKMTRAYGCNNIIASENMLTFRSGAAGYYDLTSNSGTGNLGGFKSGCTSNLVVANGVLNAPDYTRTCSCSYQNQTSLALVHMPEVEMWSVNSLASAVTEETKESVLSELGLNFGAAGDRRDADGTLWLEYPAKAGASPPFTLAYNSDATVYSEHSASRSSDPKAWISSSGIEGLRALKVGLDLAGEVDLAKGIPVAHVDDDAEESEAGDVELSSSDLELTEDGGIQTVGIRFASVPLPRDCGDKIKEAYIQFTCDEPSADPTSLVLAGVLEPNTERFEASSNDVSSRNRTQNEVTWSPPEWKKIGQAGEAQRTPNIAALVREILEQPDWEPGNSMAFVIGGNGKRTAVSYKAKNKGAAKLVIVADVDVAESKEVVETAMYEVQLVFSAPRGSTEARVFDVAVQGKSVASDVKIEPRGAATVLKLKDVEIGDSLQLSLMPKQGQPVLSGLRLERQNEE